MSEYPHIDEPLRVTLTRTVSIAVIGGAVVSHFWGGLARWPLATLLLFWPSFGGHWVDLWYLNWLRARLPEFPGVLAISRLAVWFVAGIVFGAAMWCTATLLIGSMRVPRMPSMAWCFAALAFVGIELLVQVGLVVRGQPSFFNGRA